MPGFMHDPPRGFVTVAQAREQLGVSKPTMVRLLKRYGLEVFHDPRDARVKLLKVEDLERLSRPLSTSEAEELKTAA